MKYLRGKYGNPDEIAGAYVINLLEMPAVTERDVARIHQFYEKLLFNIESLETLVKLDTVQGMTYYDVIVKKLELLRSELVSHVPRDWRSWSFGDLLEALRKWTGTNPVVETFGKGTNPKRSTLPSDRIYHSQDRYVGNCVYCDSGEHRSSKCNKLSTLDARKVFLANKRLRFNCAAGQHSANQCPSKLSCRVCRRRHHTSICQQASVEPNLKANIVGSSVIHPVVVVDVGGHKFRALLDSGASHS